MEPGELSRSQPPTDSAADIERDVPRDDAPTADAPDDDAPDDDAPDDDALRDSSFREAAPGQGADVAACQQNDPTAIGPSVRNSNDDELRGQELDAVIAAIVSQPGTSIAGVTPRVIQPRPPGIPEPISNPTGPQPTVVADVHQQGLHTKSMRPGPTRPGPTRPGPTRPGAMPNRVAASAGIILLVLAGGLVWWMYGTTKTSNPESASVRTGTRTRAASTIGATDETVDATTPITAPATGATALQPTTATTATPAPVTTATPVTTPATETTTTIVTTTTVTKTTIATTTTVTTTTPPQPTNERDAIDQLEAWRNEGLTQISFGTGGYFVQFSAKQIGVFDEEQGRRYDTWQSIVDDHRRFRERYGAILLFSDDVDKNPPGYYLTWYPTHFPDKQAARAWCDTQGLGENYCLPRVAP